MEVLWGGERTAPFTLSRGLRQGDPLSPFLFVLCMERLSHAIREEVEEGRWKPVMMTPHGPGISHLFFADDLVLFAEANSAQAKIISKVLQRFCEASGEKVNRSKSRLFCSNNVSINLVQNISAEYKCRIGNSFNKESRSLSWDAFIAFSSN